MLRSWVKIHSPKARPSAADDQPAEQQGAAAGAHHHDLAEVGQDEIDFARVAGFRAHAGLTPRVASTVRIAVIISRIVINLLCWKPPNRLAVHDQRVACKGRAPISAAVGRHRRTGPRRRRGRGPGGRISYGVTQPQVRAAPVPVRRHTVLGGH